MRRRGLLAVLVLGLGAMLSDGTSTSTQPGREAAPARDRGRVKPTGNGGGAVHLNCEDEYGVFTFVQYAPFVMVISMEEV